MRALLLRSHSRATSAPAAAMRALRPRSHSRPPPLQRRAAAGGARRRPTRCAAAPNNLGLLNRALESGGALDPAEASAMAAAMAAQASGAGAASVLVDAGPHADISAIFAAAITAVVALYFATERIFGIDRIIAQAFRALGEKLKTEEARKQMEASFKSGGAGGAGGPPPPGDGSGGGGGGAGGPPPPGGGGGGGGGT